MNFFRAGMVIGALAFALVWLGGALAAQDTRPRPAKVFVVRATEDVLRRTYPAIVLPSRQVELSFRVSGRVIDLPIRASQEVAAGDVIARVDPRDFETQVARVASSVAQADAQLDALRAGARPEEISALEAAVESAQAQLDAARDAAERTRTLRDRGVAPIAHLQAAEAEFRVARANLRAQEEQLRIGLAGGRPEEIAAAEAALDGLEAQLRVARDNLNDATLRAPFDGIVARRYIENFLNVQAGQSVALIQAIDVVHLAFDIPGPDVTTLARAGTDAVKAVAVFDALPDRAFDTELVEFSVQADSASQTYRGRVAVHSPQDALILPGMVARVILTAPRNDRHLRVPITAIASFPDGAPFVWVVDAANAVSARPVTLGPAAGDMVAVEAGIEAGTAIVSAGVGRLVEGQTVRPIASVGD